MRLHYDIEPSQRPEKVLQNIHWALKYRYYHLAFVAMYTLLLLLIFRVARLIRKQPTEVRNNVNVAVVALLSIYISVIEIAISLFSFGTLNRFDPLQNLSVFDARIALNVLKQKAPWIYGNNVYRMIAESPEYIRPNQKIGTNIIAIDQESPYTALKLAKELGAHNITDLFKSIADEEKMIFLLLRSFVSKDGDLAKLNSDAIAHILSFLTGGKISELKSKE